MVYKIFNVAQDGQKMKDVAIIPDDNSYRFFQYEDSDKYTFVSFGSTKGDKSFCNVEGPKSMNYRIELKDGTQLFFRKEKNMWKWLYEHHDDFRVDSYGEYR